MLTSDVIIHYLSPMNNCVVKASESYEKYYKFAKDVLWISTQLLSNKAEKPCANKENLLEGFVAGLGFSMTILLKFVVNKTKSLIRICDSIYGKHQYF